MILRISYKDHVTNEEVREKTQWTVGPYGDLTIVQRRKLQWYGQVSQNDNNYSAEDNQCLRCVADRHAGRELVQVGRIK